MAVFSLCSHMEERKFGVSFLLFKYFIYLFLAALSLCFSAGFSLVAESGGPLSSCSVGVSHCGGFSCRGAQALGIQAAVFVVRGFSSCGYRALEHRLSCRGT